ncbi:hypothetical protein Tco_0805646 [Tanacetum coccineum]
MTTLQFADTHNMVAFLSKPAESEGFEQIMDFLNAHIINAKTTAWNEFSSTMASAIICLATNQNFNFSKYIFENMVKNLEDVYGKFLMYPRFVQVFLNKQMEGMSTHKRIYVTPSHTKKIVGNMKRVGKGFSGIITPLFPTMLVQDQEEMGEGLAIPTDPHHTPIIIKSTSQPPKKQRSRRPKKKDTQIPQSSVPSDNVADEVVKAEMDDSLVMAATTATSLDAKQDSGNINKTQSKATPNEPSSPGTSSGGGPRRQETMGDIIAQIRSENVSKLSNDPLLAREHKDCSSLGDYKFETKSQEVREERRVKNSQAQKIIQGRKIDDIDKDAEITLVDETQGRHGNDIMFDVSDLPGEEVFVAEQGVPDISAASITDVEITLAQALAELKSAKPTTTASIRPRAKGLVIHEEEQATTPTISLQQPSQVKIQDKGMIEREKAEKEAKVNIALEETWDDIQAKIDVDCLLAERLQAREQEELTIEERAILFQQLLEKRRKHFAAKRAKEKRNKPPIRAQQRSIMCTYLKNMEGWKPKDLKSKTELVVGSLKKAKAEIAQESSSKRTRNELEQENEEEVAIDAIPLATTPLTIVDWKIHKEGKNRYYQIIRADGSSKMYRVFSLMLKSFDRQDLEDLYNLVKAKYGSTRPVEDLDLILYGDLKTMFDPHVEDQVWKNQQDYKVLDWKLYDSCGVHSLRMQHVYIHMLVEKRYPLTPATITDMLNKKLQADHWNEMCYQLLKLITKQLKNQ